MRADNAGNLAPRRTGSVLGLVAAAAVLATALGAPDRSAQAAAPRAGASERRTVWDSVYSAAQATRGQTAYGETCSRCHQPSLGGADESPALAGGAFLSNWSGFTLAELQDRIRTTMPRNDPGIYGRQLVTDVLAYMLQVNGFPAGAADLPVEAEALAEIRILDARPPAIR